MGEYHSNHKEALLPSTAKTEEEGYGGYGSGCEAEDKATPDSCSSLSLRVSKWVVKLAMWSLLAAWIALIFVYPSEFGNELFEGWLDATSSTVFGVTGGVFLAFGAPILICAFLAIVHLVIRSGGGFEEEEMLHQEKKKGRRRSAHFRLWTFPVIADGPFGVVSAAELIGILLVSVYVIWAVSVYTVRNYSLLSSFTTVQGEKTNLMLELTGLRLGIIGLICMALLFLPVARGSVLLRLLDIPFEHAARYHVWLGHLTMVLFTLHGLFYAIPWAIEGHLLHSLVGWKNIGVAVLPGVISLVAGLLMWVTSLPQVRRRVNFELFFYTHQLYVVFVVFLALHVGDFIFSIAAAPIFLFMLDRFLRFCQSRRTVDVLSAVCLPSGTVELVISKPQSLRYNALSWIFLQVRELSWLQWHPFSVSSSPLDGKHHLTILIKVLGDWTEKLRDHILNVSVGKPRADHLLPASLKLRASVEGPYGHESPYHLTYENLLLVAGGIGISPFLAILRDILHRKRDRKACRPRNILIVWAVKTSDELPLLHSFDMESLCPGFYNVLNIEIQTYVTRETESPVEEGGTIPKDMMSSCIDIPAPTRYGGMSSLVGTGNIIWSGIYVMVPTIGLAASFGLLNLFYINPYNISFWWYKGLLLTICMTASVVIFGGIVIQLWSLWERTTSSNSASEESVGNTEKSGSNTRYNEFDEKAIQETFISTTKYGRRPDFTEIFEAISDRWGNVDIGVIVCGPSALQASIAKECRTKNFGRKKNDPIFHFNSHSFDL